MSLLSLQRLVFYILTPLTLFASCLIRYNAFSAIYLLFLLILPIILGGGRSWDRSKSLFQRILLIFSVFVVFSQIVVQIVMVVDHPYGHYFANGCSMLALLLQQIGFNQYKDVKAYSIIRLLVPDIAVMVVSLISVVTHRRKPIPRKPSRTRAASSTSPNRYTLRLCSTIAKLFPLFVGGALVFAGIMQPNILSSVYFLTFLVVGMSWSFHLQIDTMLSWMKIILMTYSGCHTLLLYLYQFSFFQRTLTPEGLVPRLVGLTAVINSTYCDTGEATDVTLVRTHTFPFYCYPFIVLLLYISLTLQRIISTFVETETEASFRELSSYPVPATTDSLQTGDTGKEGTALLTDANGISQQYGAVQSVDGSTNEQQQQLETSPEKDNEEAEEVMMGSKNRKHEPKQKQKVELLSQSTVYSMGKFLMRQSYIATLIIMMLWSILYHSWLTFVLLLWACITWITPFARRFCMTSSPYLVVYSDLLLLLQYMYGMDLTEEELPLQKTPFSLSGVGMTRYTYPVMHIAVQVLFTLFFFVTLRQHFAERKDENAGDASSQNRGADAAALTTITGPLFEVFRTRVNSMHLNLTPTDNGRDISGYLKSALGKYWIVFCCLSFLLVALQNDVSLYQIVYMVIFLLVFIIYQFSMRTWKVVLKPLWWFMVIYSILILLMIYTYQFKDMPQWWRNMTGLKPDMLHDIGLRQQGKADLLMELFIPTVFSIVIVIQLHFFHKSLVMKVDRLLRYRKPRGRITSHDNPIVTPTSSDPSSQEETEIQSNGIPSNIMPTKGTFDEVRELYRAITVTLWRLSELHISKCIYFATILVVVQRVSVINGVYVVLLALALPNLKLQKFVDYLLIVWASISVTVFMLYQLRSVEKEPHGVNCTAIRNASEPFPTPARGSHFVSNTWWIGFYKVEHVRNDVFGYLCVVVFVVLKKVTRHHQEVFRFKRNLPNPPLHDDLFEDITRSVADASLLNGVKYLCNNFFRLFGFKMNLMMMVITMTVRGDAIAFLHSFWLILFLSLKWSYRVKIWPVYKLYMAILLPFQYILVLGIPPSLCLRYPWANWNVFENIVQWLYLTDVQRPQDQHLLLLEYFQLAVACCYANALSKQCPVKKPKKEDPDSCLYHREEEYTPPDYTHNKTLYDFTKILIFDHFFYVTLFVIYCTGQYTKSIFNSVYIIGCFFFLWHGKDLYLRPKAQIKRWWRCMIIYNFFVVFCKVVLQLPSCVFIKDIYKDNNCYLFQLLSLYCTRKEVYRPMNTEECTVLGNGVAMDCVCFVFVLIQYAIFQSPYFIFIVNDHRQYLAMSSRAAQLVQERLQIRLQKSKQSDARNMARIKRKVSNARHKLKNFHAKGDPSTAQPSSHYEAIYTADAYLFQEESDPDSELDEDRDYEDVEDTTLSSGSLATLEEDIVDDLPSDHPHTETTTEEYTTDAMDGMPVSKPVLTDTAVTKSSSYNMYDSGLNKPADSIDMLSSIDDKDNYQLIGYEKDETQWADHVSKKVRTFKEVMQDWCHKLTELFNNLSVDYRNVTVQLTREKREMLKQNADKYIPPLDVMDIGDGNEGCVDVEIILEDKSATGRKTGISVIEESVESSNWKKEHSVVSCAVAFYYVVLAHSDLFCYILMIANHIVNASLLSLPLPIMVFLWGMLSVNRATKRFWITTVTYVEIMVVIKYVLQFQFPIEKNFNECSFYKEFSTSPLCPPRIIGIERIQGNDNSYVWDLLLLLVLLFHISSLKTQGLWRNKYVDRKEDEAKENELTVSGRKRRRDIYVDTDDDDTLRDEDEEGGFFNNVRSFFKHIKDPDTGTGSVDVYAWMFGIQLIVFIIIITCWSSFDPISSSEEQANRNIINNIIEGSAVPKTFLYLSLAWFLITIFDRGVYMKKSVILKLAYLVVLVVFFHLFLFILVPYWRKKGFTENPPAVLMYLFLCIYFMLSAYQVRRGYPTHILCNFLTKNYNVFNAVLFQGIQAIPFLLELRSVLDWVLTDTTLTLSHWLKMEDIYANVYLIKCWRDSEKIWPHPRGMAYWRSSKWWIGGLVVFSLVFVIWFPLLFMSMINMAYLKSHPVEVTFTLTIGGYQPLFKVTTQQQFLRELSSPTDLDQIIRHYITHSKSNNPEIGERDCWRCQSLRSYTKGQGHLLGIKMLSNSSSVWSISPPARDLLINDLNSNSTITLRFEYSFRREQLSTQAVVQQETVSGSTKTILEKGNPIRAQMANVLTNTTGDGEIQLPKLFPTFVQTPASGTVKNVPWLDKGSMVNCSIILRRGSIPHISHPTLVEWWELKQDSPKPWFSAGPGYLEVIALCDVVPPLFLSFFVSKGVIGLYVGFVWLIGKFVRIYFTSISYRIMFDEMPNVNRILNLCLEIYMARESAELELEEDLFAKLLFLYRSPETLIKFTKYKKFKTS